jgi:ABC-type transporter Mla MlaB component
MAEPKDGESFLRKVARFVANPTTDWAEINSRQDDPEGDLAKAELRAMVERKRRNDFVRKRELDMLRRIRREGLSPEQLAALGSSSSRMDEMERSNSDLNSKIDHGVKAKIDQIEQQMVGESFAPTQLAGNHPPGFFETSTRPVHFDATRPAEPPASALPKVSQFSTPAEIERLESVPPPAAAVMGAGLPPLSDAKPSVLPSLPPLQFNPDSGHAPLSFVAAERATAAIEVNELVHDPELDEMVIAFANADHEACERGLTALIQKGGPRHLHAETWLVLFDLYRATAQQAKFEALALDYVPLFGSSAPQWFSLPKLVAEAAKKERAPMGQAGGVAWTAPEYLDAEAVALLAKRCQNLPMPWVLDWAQLRQLDTEGCARLRELFRAWAQQQVDMRWLAGDQFLQQLKDLAPVGSRDVDPVLWMLRLEALRLVNRPDQFDEAAIDYCVTYEVSPPSWERAKCRVRVSGDSISTSGPATTTAAPETSTSFLESTITEQTQMKAAAQLELSGQLSGDISETLRLMSSELGAATQIFIACPKLIRLDFMAAGDLLNWVLARRGENRAVTFTEAHRLVALFFGAMGINEHAKVKVRQA